MAVRPYWRGYLKLSLVNCPVTLSPVTTDGEKLKFHTINRTTNHRITTRYVDAVSGKVVDKDDQAKGYPKAEDDYVIIDDDELDEVKLESVRTIDIDEFAPSDSVEWTYFDSPYFVTPSDQVGEEAFIVIRQAMQDADVVGIARLVINGRERAVMLQPWNEGIVLWTLRFGDEIRDENEYWNEVDDRPVDKKMLAMVEQLIEDRTTTWSDDMVEDPVQDRLLDMIKQKQHSKKKKAPSKAVDEGDVEQPNNVIDLMAALKKSLESKPDEAPKKKSRR
ncbi:Ku protein [Devosia sp. LjRoot3]|uniref:non-homologous end joining protein Ku n=1 Tax=Devosia sp. LjRoot3 TaxID=3342319 RepID=UPI003ECF84E4